MARCAAESPSGRISEVFAKDKERQGAYDLLESGQVEPAAVAAALAEATARRGAQEPFVFVAVDGSSVKLGGRSTSKDFGSVGNLDRGARGLKVISALGITPEGVPLGLFAQVWWSRTQARSQSGKQKRRRNHKRKVEEKETRYWLQALEQATACARTAHAKLWFQLDREADNRDILLKLAQTGQQFTVRSSWDRLIEATGNDRQHLRRWLAQQAPGGRYVLEVSAGPNRMERSARMVMRWACVVLRLRNGQGHRERPLQVTAVWAREQGTCPRGEKPVDWLLLTSVSVRSLKGAQAVVTGYARRWRVEEMHKTWKTGACNVEQTQLRSSLAVRVWATLLAAVAVRIERLKLLSRNAPEQPASIELSPHEIRALILLKREAKKRTEVIPDAMPTIGQATVWIAELGGYTGKSSGGPPGSITIRRGLERLRPAATLLKALKSEPR
jgi:hypothetical protein